ncbi:MAG: ssuA [Comamonadaceae bacterium]|nr:MAG: ssuA [Comamonadaceae bacterium]
MKNLILWLTSLLLFSLNLAHAANQTVRVGVLEFGTVNWELEVMRTQELAKKRGVDLVIVPLASGDASTVALQGGSVDVIVSDWIWVSRQRADGRLFSFVTYSNAVGALVVPAQSTIKSVADLQGKKIGVSGGPNDKIWTLLRAHAQRNLNLDLAKATQPSFGAPPLLNELVQRQQLDAVLNTWPFTARLQAKGMRQLVDLPDVLAGLGIHQPIPLIGWVFKEDWAEQNKALLNQFLAASLEAKQLMKTSDVVWDKLKPKMRAEDDAVFVTLRQTYRAGIPACLDQTTRNNIALTHKILFEVGGEKLAGKSDTLAPGTFWAGYEAACPKP